jgi:hypothetical protein
MDPAENGVPRSLIMPRCASSAEDFPQRPRTALRTTWAQVTNEGDEVGIQFSVALAPLALADFTSLALAGTT